MTKLVVLSDSHGNAGAIARVLAAEPQISAVIYLGDGLHDLESVIPDYRGLRFYSVSGNCDFRAFEPQEALAPFGGMIVYYTHGHVQGVKYDRTALLQSAKKRGAQIALFGHTHKTFCETVEGVTLFNPGSCGRCYTGNNTYGLLTIEDGKLIRAEHKEVPAQ